MRELDMGGWKGAAGSRQENKAPEGLKIKQSGLIGTDQLSIYLEASIATYELGVSKQTSS